MISAHDMLEVSSGRHVCPDTWCSGKCGLPALVLKYREHEYKAHGSQVACGPVFQSFRVKAWTGEKIEADLSQCTAEGLLKRTWW